MPALQILSNFSHLGGTVIATRDPVIGDIVRVVGPGGSAQEYVWTAPAQASASPRPRLLTPNQVIDLILETVGVAAFAAMVRSDLDAMVAWRYKLSVARDITKTQASAGLQIIVDAGLMTANQRTAILAAWPSA
jgi:hypothetical protein